MNQDPTFKSLGCNDFTTFNTFHFFKRVPLCRKCQKLFVNYSETPLGILIISDKKKLWNFMLKSNTEIGFINFLPALNFPVKFHSAEKAGCVRVSRKFCRFFSSGMSLTKKKFSVRLNSRNRVCFVSIPWWLQIISSSLTVPKVSKMLLFLFFVNRSSDFQQFWTFQFKLRTFKLSNL